MTEQELWARVRAELAWPRRLLKLAAFLAVVGAAMQVAEWLWH